MAGAAAVVASTGVGALSDLAPANAVFTMDTGASTHFAARIIQLRGDQHLREEYLTIRLVNPK